MCILSYVVVLSMAVNQHINVKTVREFERRNMVFWITLHPGQLDCYDYDLVLFILIVIYSILLLDCSYPLSAKC